MRCVPLMSWMALVAVSTACDEAPTEKAGPETDCTSPSAYFGDADGDGFGGGRLVVEACTAPEGFVDNDLDCDDLDPASHPDAPEVCDEADNDCDGTIDEDVQLPFYADTDADGFGDEAQPTEACTAPEGFVDNALDCDDADGLRHPDALEVCDGLDNNCDGATDDADPMVDHSTGTQWFPDVDADGFGDSAAAGMWACDDPSTAEGAFTTDATDCDDTDPLSHPAGTEVCDGADNNCDGTTDEGVLVTWYADRDVDGYGASGDFVEACEAPDGFLADASDCDDAQPAVFPGGTEVCDLLDNNCDGTVDEGVQTTFYADADLDGFGSATHTTRACTVPSGFVAEPTDCDDSTSTAYPGATEYCDTIDNNCDGDVDEGLTTTYYQDADGDGYGDSSTGGDHCLAPSGMVTADADCDDTDATTYPGATEWCDGIDNDCDGSVFDETNVATFTDSAGNKTDVSANFYYSGSRFRSSADGTLHLCRGGYDNGLSLSHQVDVVGIGGSTSVELSGGIYVTADASLTNLSISSGSYYSATSVSCNNGSLVMTDVEIEGGSRGFDYAIESFWCDLEWVGGGWSDEPDLGINLSGGSFYGESLDLVSRRGDYFYDGGAIDASNAHVELLDVDVRGLADQGGGINLYSSDLIAEDSDIEGDADSGGDGIYVGNNSTAELTNTSVTGTTADGIEISGSSNTYTITASSTTTTCDHSSGTCY